MHQPSPLDLATVTLNLASHGLLGDHCAAQLPWPRSADPEQLLEVAHTLHGVALAGHLLHCGLAEEVARFVEDDEADLAAWVASGDPETLHWALQGARTALRMCWLGEALH